MKNKYLTNQQLLTELKERLPNFTEEEFTTLMKTIAPYHQKLMKFIQATSSKAYQAVQEKLQEWEQERTEEEIEKIKKSLEKK